MQTFLPYGDFNETAKCLDNKRLGKQRVEAWQIYQIVSGKRTTGGWINHPAVKMWQGYKNALSLYYFAMQMEWNKRMYQNTMEPLPITLPVDMPPFIGNDAFHDSHKSNLLRKEPEFYGLYDWQVPNNLPYIWPSKITGEGEK